jgi:hypothetical protein
MEAGSTNSGEKIGGTGTAATRAFSLRIEQKKSGTRLLIGLVAS